MEKPAATVAARRWGTGRRRWRRCGSWRRRKWEGKEEEEQGTGTGRIRTKTNIS
jgi:hypothetical protein